jgi:hypothetical protein
VVARPLATGGGPFHGMFWLNIMVLITGMTTIIVNIHNYRARQRMTKQQREERDQQIDDDLFIW